MKKYVFVGTEKERGRRGEKGERGRRGEKNEYRKYENNIRKRSKLFLYSYDRQFQIS